MPFAPDSTTRWFLKYSVSGDEHVMQMRSSSGITAEQASSAFNDFLAALEGDDLLYEITIIELSRAATGVNSREPQEWSGAPTYGSGAMPEVTSPRFMSFSGRASGNQQVRVFVYGFKGTTPDNYRLTSVDAEGVATAVDILNGFTNVFTSAGLNHPIWKPYANVGFNSYYERKQRIVA
jgi:hypothetical protein